MTPQATTPATKDNKTGAKPPTNGAKDAAPATTETTAAPATTEEKPKRVKRAVFIVEGKIRMFDNARDAEAFLNGGEDVPETFRVIKGSLVEQKQKVSLR